MKKTNKIKVEEFIRVDHAGKRGETVYIIKNE